MYKFIYLFTYMYTFICYIWIEMKNIFIYNRFYIKRNFTVIISFSTCH